MPGDSEVEKYLASMPTVNSAGPAGMSNVIPGVGVSKAENGYYSVFMGKRRSQKARYKTPLIAGEKNAAGNKMHGKDASDYAPHMGPGPEKDSTLPLDEATSQIRKWDSMTLRRWEKKLLDNGIIKPGEYTYETLVTKWQDYTTSAAQEYTLGHKKVTPWDMVDTDGEISGTKKTGPVTEHATNTSTNLTDPASAKALLSTMLQKELGRDAKPAEIEDFLATLNHAERSNPTITKSTTVTDPVTNNRDTTSSSSGGLGAPAYETMGKDFAKRDPEYGAYQASTTYFNALLNAIQSPV